MPQRHYYPQDDVEMVRFAHAKLTGTGTQTITTNTSTKCLLFDAQDLHETQTEIILPDIGNDRLHIKRDGIYMINAHCHWANNNTGKRSCMFYLNTALKAAFDTAPPVGQAHGSVHWIGHLEVNDTIELWVYQKSGGNLALQSTYTYLAVTYLGEP